MNVVFVSIDSLNRDFLEAYGRSVELDVSTPNLDRFSRRAAVFESHYAGSLPCMPARREFFTGVQEFLWRPWGPVEPFDAPVARAARQSGVVTQFVTDHYHLFQHGSNGYFQDYHGFEFVRGHENDAWRTSPREPDPVLMAQIRAGEPDPARFMDRAAYARNVAKFETEEDFFPAKVFSSVARWLEENWTQERWMLVVDSFDVHEPFHVPEPYASMYTDTDPRDPAMISWPLYGRTDTGASQLTDQQLAFVRAQYAGKLTMLDKWFGKVLDKLDEQDLWDQTLVIVTTDHGHYLGEHNWMGKPFGAPIYDVLAHTPLFIWHPHSQCNGGRVPALTSAVDLYATMLDALDVKPPASTHSHSLLPLLRGERESVRDWALYGYWGSTINVTDGRHTYLRPCRDDRNAYCYSTTMIDPNKWFDPARARPEAEAGKYLPYTDSPVWRYPAGSHARNTEPLLFDVREDPGQQQNLAGRGAAEEERMRGVLVEALREIEAPEEQYARLGLG